MKISVLRPRHFIFALLLAATQVALRAEDPGAVKTRMEQRLAQLEDFKARGLLGENNRGLIELRGADTAAGDAMAGENRDRAEVYAMLAKQTGASPGQVGRARAKQIAAGSAAGVWLQREDGSWYRK